MATLTLKKNNNELQYFQAPGLRDMAHALYQRGGSFQKASNTVMTIIGRVASGFGNPLEGLKATNHGETRLRKCVKYDLTGACRLVTVQDGGKVILLFVGDHDDEDKWLDAKRGCKFVVDGKGRLDCVPEMSSTLGPGERVPLPSEYTKGKLFELLCERDFDELVESVPRSSIRIIEGLHSFSSDDEVFDSVENIEDEGIKELVLDVLVALKAGDVEGAQRRLAYQRGELSEISEKLADESERIFQIPQNDPSFSELFSHFVKTADYKQWMLFMHPEQQEIVDKDFTGSAKLLGVSGSGKTCVVVKRAIRLAEKYPDENVLIVTLNRSLARLIRELVDVVALESVKGRVQVKPFFSVCQEYLHELEPGSDKLYDDTTWKSKEHIDEVWSEYYRCELNNHDAEILLPVHDYLIAQGISAESYIREEFDWIRSAVQSSERKKYLKIERAGRSIPMLERYRRLLLDGLRLWEKKMHLVGVTDYLGLAAALSKHQGKLEKRYRCVLVDESQDFGSTELSLIREITKKGENDVFICGDAAQRVSTKYQSLRMAGINIPSSHSQKLSKNYRNSREILSAAFKVLFENITESNFDSEDFEVLDPEYSSFSGSTPLTLSANSLSEEIAFAHRYAKQVVDGNSSWKVCIALCGYSLYELKHFCKNQELILLDGEASLGDGSIFLSDLEQTKGFEFDVMMVVNASSGVFPNPALPRDEHFRELCHFYVALTRAKSELIVSYSGSPSSILDNTDDVFIVDRWESYLPKEILDIPTLPKRINEVRKEGAEASDVLYMCAPSFLYTEEAIGINGELISKLRELVDGKAINRQGHLVRWKNLGSAYDSIMNSPRSRNAFGPERIKEFRLLCEGLDFPALLRQLNIREVYQGVRNGVERGDL
ncbi:UvrD-helicase domain-containing protein [Spongiibacter marinus]|uniref:UvrD-helicase domain-containing protein n=1 Tax=Spongiibacter marinus TaxID=354246 RepID=UPI0003FEC636|nr:UvrD-helicase domain-containing protein [Spongiibacter marinus]